MEVTHSFVAINEGAEPVNDEMLRIRREMLNAAVEVVGYDPIKIEQYLSRKDVA